MIKRYWLGKGAGAANQRMKPTLLSRVYVGEVSVFWLFEYSLVALRKPQGGLCAIRYAAQSESEATFKGRSAQGEVTCQGILRPRASPA
jgi:hypothetical protein